MRSAAKAATASPSAHGPTPRRQCFPFGSMRFQSGFETRGLSAENPPNRRCLARDFAHSRGWAARARAPRRIPLRSDRRL
jgi:hypothetical protein